MAWKSLGKVTVTTAGTPVRATSTSTPAQSIMIQAFPTNVGLAYVGLSGMNKATGAGVLAIIGKPSADEVSVPSVSASIPLAPAGLNVADLYIDADDNGAGVIISYTEQ